MSDGQDLVVGFPLTSREQLVGFLFFPNWIPPQYLFADLKIFLFG